MQNNQVKVTYSAYGTIKTVKEIELELVKDIALKLTYNEDSRDVTITMTDTVTDDTTLAGSLDSTKLNELIHAMGQIRNQLQ